MMPHTKAHIIPCHESLPRYLVERLATLAEKDFSKIAIILPTQRLQHYIRLELGLRFTSCIPPRLFTIASFARTLYAPDQRRVISETEQNIILNALLLDGDFHYLRAGMEDDLARFFNELADQNVTNAAFSRIKSLLKNDLYRDEVHLTRLTEQTAELEKFYQAYTTFLDAHHLIDASLHFLQTAMFASKQQKLSRLRRYSKIWIAGFSDATATQLVLLRKLQEHQGCKFFFHLDRETLEAARRNMQNLSPYAPTLEFIKSLGFHDFEAHKNSIASANTHFARKVFGLIADKNTLKNNTIYLHSAASQLIEVKAAAALVHRLVRNGQANLDEIVLVAPDENRYGSLLRSVFAEARIPISDSLGRPLNRTQVGQLLRLLLDIVSKNWRIPDLVSLLNNQLIQAWLASLDLTTDTSILQETVRRFADKYSISASLPYYIRKKKTPITEIANHAPFLFFFEHLENALKRLLQTQERTMGQWAEDLWQTLESFALEKLILQQSADSLESELATLKRIYASLQHIRQLNRLMPEKRKRSEFYYLLLQNVFSMQIRLTGQPFSCVQVMGLLEARSLPAKVLILLGNIEGCFPTSLHRELFVPEPFRNELGLTTHKKLERLQDQQFFALISSFSRSHLFYCTQDEDRPAVKSRYLQRMELLNTLQPDVVQTIEEDGLLFIGDFLSLIDLQMAPPSLQGIYQNIQAQCAGRRGVRGDFQEDRAPLFSAMSPSSMEHLLFCPYRYLLHKLQFSEMDLPDDDMDSREAGRWLHEVCECFFKGMESAPAHWPELGKPRYEPVHEQNRARALTRLQQLSRALMDQNRSRLDYLYQMHYIGWQKFLDREMQRAGVSMPDSKYEFRLQHAKEKILQVANFEIDISGRVDRIAVADDEIRIIDYKTRQNWPNKKRISEGKAPQLPLYVEMLRRQKEYRQQTKWTAEYFALWDGKSDELQEHAPKLEISESWRNLTAHLEQRLTTLLVQKHPMQPEENKEICKYCDYAGICRRQEDWVDRL